MRLAAGDSSYRARAVGGWLGQARPATLAVTAHEPEQARRQAKSSGRRFESCRGHMERRDRPNIDTVREVLQEEDDRVREEPPSPPTEEESSDADDEGAEES